MLSNDSKNISWDRLAEPQADQYDSAIVLEHAHKNGYNPESSSVECTSFDGHIRVRSNTTWNPERFAPAPVNHANIEGACELLRKWPRGFTQCQLLLETLYVSLDKKLCSNSWGYSSGPGPSGFGTICATINNMVGLAEAICHEMAHHKLRALGVGIDTANTLIINSSDQKFYSPIRYDQLRPMTAVIHAQYSYTYIASFDIEFIRSGADLIMSQRIAQFSLAHYLPKLAFGFELIRSRVETDRNGDEFMKGFLAWIDQILADGYRILHDFQIQPKTFVHPLKAVLL